jgi:hypothetical protein
VTGETNHEQTDAVIKKDEEVEGGEGCGEEKDGEENDGEGGEGEVKKGEGEEVGAGEDGKPKTPMWDWKKRGEGCGVCGVSGCSIVCEKCNKVRYCSTDHQRTDWKLHRRLCSPSKDPFARQTNDKLGPIIAQLRKEASAGSAEAQFKLGHAAIHAKVRVFHC